MKLKYYKNLDGMRAIAALMVMFFHFFMGIQTHSKFLEILSKTAVFGQTGVTLFFVLSGFLITRILFFTKTKESYFKNFYLRRVLRIFPLYYLVLVIYYFITPFIFNSPRVPFGQQIYFYTYLQNFAETFNWPAGGPGHFWSLAVEEHFYLFWPLLVFLLDKKNLLRAIIGIIISALLLRIVMENAGYQVDSFTFTRFDSLAIGALLALLECKNYFKEENSSRFLFLSIIVFLPTILIWPFFTGKANYYIQLFKYLFLSFTYFSFLAYVLSIKQSHFINKILESHFFSYTGKISYGLYVYHPLMYLLANKFLNTNSILLNMIIRFSLTYIIASISFYFFESKFLKLKRYFEYNKQKSEIVQPQNPL